MLLTTSCVYQSVHLTWVEECSVAWKVFLTSSQPSVSVEQATFCLILWLFLASSSFLLLEVVGKPLRDLEVRYWTRCCHCADNTQLVVPHISFSMIHIASVERIVQCLPEMEACTRAVWSANIAVAEQGKGEKMVLCQHLWLMSLTTICDTYFRHAVYLCR